MDKVQYHIWDKLCEMSGETVARAFTDYHSNDLMNEGFYRHLVDEGLIEDDLGLCESDDEEDDEEA